MSVEESIGEAGYQYCIQWLFYFVVVSHHAASDSSKDRTLFSDSLRFTTIISIISLSVGQFKVQYITNKLTKLGRYDSYTIELLS